jgi:hypothetical protein
MMNEFLDLAYQKRFRIISIIFNSEKHQIHQKKLLQKLGISLTTLNHTLELIQEDLAKFNCQDQLAIQFDSTEKNYFLTINLDFKLDLLLLYYLEDSLKFQLIRGMMTDSLLSVKSISSNWFITPSTLRREIHSLQKLLHPWKLEIKTTHTKISLHGKESVIRLFYAFFFLHSYGAYKWIFQTVSYRDITKLLQFVPDDILEKSGVEKKVLLHYYCAVAIVRMKKQLYFEEDFFTLPQYNPYTHTYSVQAQKFRQQLQQLVPNLGKKDKTQKIRALFSNILALNDFSDTDFPARFFLLDTDLQEKHFLKMIFEIHDCFCCIFNGNKSILFQKLCNIHYRVLLYGMLQLEEIDMWASYSDELSVLEKEKLDLVFQQLEKFVFNNPHYEWVAQHKQFIYQQYAQLIDKHLMPLDLLPVINISLYSKFSTARLKNILLSTFSQHAQMNISDTIHQQTDIVISDLILSKEVFENLGITCKIIYIQLPLSENDYQKLQKNFIQISKEKIKINS